MPMNSNRSHARSEIPVKATEATSRTPHGLERKRHACATALEIRTRKPAGPRALPGLVSVLDVSGRMDAAADWQGHTLPANVVVLSVTTGGEIASDKDDRAAPVLALTGVATRAAGYAVSREVTATLGLLDPRWLHAVFGVEAQALTDRRVGLGDVVPAGRRAALQSAMRAAAGAQGRIEVLEQWLRELAREAHAARALWQQQQHLPPQHDRGHGPDPLLSQRQRERLFLREHGLSRSRHVGVERFQRTVTGLAADAQGVALALDAGYTDQSHMCRSVRAFSGLSPTQLKARLSTGVFTATYAAIQGFGKQLVL
jgi:methylphosphotriester-DNA--protein-cysteine methyltransferase